MQKTPYDKFVDALQPLLEKGATYEELCDLVIAAQHAQHTGYLTYSDVRIAISEQYDKFNESEDS